jgi:hypothetical protein
MDKDTSKLQFAFVIIMHIILIDFTVVSQLLHLITLKKLREFTETFSVFASFMSIMVETLNLLANRGKINILMHKLQSLISLLKIDEKLEGKLKKRMSQVDNIFKTNFGILAFLAVPGTVLTVTRMKLLYSAWFPFDYHSNLTAFWTLALIQTFGAITYLISTCIEFLPMIWISYMTGIMEELAVKLEDFFKNKSYQVDTGRKNTRS